MTTLCPEDATVKHSKPGSGPVSLRTRNFHPPACRDALHPPYRPAEHADNLVTLRICHSISVVLFAMAQERMCVVSTLHHLSKVRPMSWHALVLAPMENNMSRVDVKSTS